MRGPDFSARWARFGGRLRTAATPLNVVACVVALVPAARMSVWVLEGLPVHFGDYWLIIDGLYNESGLPSVRDVLSPYNGHIMVVPKGLYWVNTLVFAGSNVTLGLVVVLLGLAQVAMLWSMAPRGRAAHPLSTATVLVATGALLFAPHGAWSFLRSMSGAAWLTANTFAVAAVVLRARDRRTPSHVLALLAALSYGTGLMAFGAVVVVALVRERRVPIRDWPAVVLGGGIVAWYLIADVDPVGAVPPGAEPSLASILNGGLRLIGGLSPTPAGAAAYVGAIVAAIGALGTLWAIRARRTPGPAWVGLLAYGAACTFTIAWGRHFFTDFTDSRYASIAAMVWLPSLVLLTMLPVERLKVPQWSLAVPVLLVTGIIAVGDTGPVQAAKDTHRTQRELANAFRIGVADGGTPWLGFGVPMPPVTDRMRTLGHHPFASNHRGDCGVFGRRIDAALLVEPGSDDPPGGVYLVERGPDSIPSALLIHAYLELDERDVECLVLVDGDRRVVGLGTHGWGRPLLDGGRASDGVRALAPVGVSDVALYVRLEGDRGFVEIPDRRGLLDDDR